MELDVEYLIGFFNKFSNLNQTELGEQEETGSSDSGESTGKTPKKWESGRQFGKTYMNDPNYKWESGRQLGKTYMNDPNYTWKSDRVMGKTGGSDFS